jgi:hypothetical protein
MAQLTKRYIFVVWRYCYIDDGIKFMIPEEEITPNLWQMLECADKIGISMCEDDQAEMSETEKKMFEEINGYFSKHGKWRKYKIKDIPRSGYLITAFYEWSTSY